MVLRSFRDDCLEAYVVSYSYGMGDPLASRFKKAGRTAEGGGVPVVFCWASPVRNCLKPGTRPEGMGTESPAGCEEMTRSGDSESTKRFHHHSLAHDQVV